MAFSGPFGTEAGPFWANGPSPSGFYQFPGKSQSKNGPDTRSQYPITTGTSVFGLKFKDGVILAADCLGSYGSLARYPDIQRVHKINDTTAIASSGDIADFQYLHDVIKSKQNDEEIRGGGVTMRPESLYTWLTRVMYNRRSKFDPLWNKLIVGGMQEGKPFLGCVDMIGTAFTENAIATGIGAAMAIPLINDALEKIGTTDNLTKEQARELILKCIRLSFLRDCRATDKYHIATITDEGTEVEGPIRIDSNWEVAKLIVGYE